MLEVGDKVKIREDFDLSDATIVAGMLKYRGCDAHITSIRASVIRPGTYTCRLDIDDGLHSWNSRFLELVQPRTWVVLDAEPVKPAVFVRPVAAVKPETKHEPANPVAAAQAELVNHCLDLLDSKKADYATADYFHTFHTAAELQEITPLQALGGMAAKHVASVFKLFNEHAEGREISRELWMEKLGDVINYLLIAWAWIETVEVPDGE